MYLIGEPLAYNDSLVKQLQNIPALLTEGLTPSGPVVRVEATDDVSSHLAADQVYLIQRGLLHTFVDECALMYLQEGDFLGLRHNVDSPKFRYASDEAIELLPFLRSDLLAHINADNERQELFSQYLISQTDLLSLALARAIQPPVTYPQTDLKHFAAGEELIREGDDAKDVFVIVEGCAEAFVNGQKVGDVKKDEIFGAMAIFTREKRCAAVVASEPCTLMVIPKDQFLSLMESNPQIAHSLIESMARRIDLMNKEITQLRMPLAS